LFPLLDWLDPDDEVTAKEGAEKEYYASLPVPLEPTEWKTPADRRAASGARWSDLTREQWAAIRPLLTALPRGDLRINVNTAPELLLVDVDQVDAAAAAKAIVARRERERSSTAETSIRCRLVADPAAGAQHLRRAQHHVHGTRHRHRRRACGAASPSREPQRRASRSRELARGSGECFLDNHQDHPME